MRKLRLYLLRLNAENQALVRVLKAINSDLIRPEPRSAQSDVLQDYLNNATSNIIHLSTKSREFAAANDKFVAFLAAAAETFLSPEERQSALKQLENLKIRKNIFRKVKDQDTLENLNVALKLDELEHPIRPLMTGKIFINYRRDDSIGMAGRLHDRLAQTFGRNNLFMDVDHIPVGVDFVAHLNNQLAACGAMLTIIGPNWLTAKDEIGQRRVDNPEDFVAIEIGAALARNIPVVPVLVDGARMPKASELPDALKSLARRQAAEIRHASFGRDANSLIARMRQVLGDKAHVGAWARMLWRA